LRRGRYDSRGALVFNLSIGAVLLSQLLVSIVDDNPPFRESLRRLLRSLGHRVNTFSSATDFLASPDLKDTACLIADVHMPAMTGIELYRQLVTLGHPIPTILVTAYPSEADQASALIDGVVCYLRKPIDEEHLSRCLQRALGAG
jgi:FixJ family two-component response regulator